jgi:hypothetical protein
LGRTPKEHGLYIEEKKIIIFPLLKRREEYTNIKIL